MPAPTKSTSQTRARYDKEAAKEAARGLWPSIHLHTCGITSDFLKTQHGPCPRHGGKDKWRIFSDYEDTGGCICNDCGPMADGLAVVRIFNGGCSLPEAINLVGDYLGLRPKEYTKKASSQEIKDPAKHLELLGPNPAMATVWCAIHKKGIAPEALWAFGAQYAIYRKRYPVFALPIRGQQNETGGWCLYHATGKELPIFAKGSKEPAEWTKIKITSGSKSGWIGPIPKPTDKIIWKTEGPSCALATYSLGLSEGHSVCCNAFGAEENPASTPWMLERFKGIEEVFVVHDNDRSGQRGATEVINENGTSRPGWAPAIANFAKQVHNYVLPWPMVDSHGQDLRDLINQRRSESYTNGEIREHILAAARMAPIVEPMPVKGMVVSSSGDDNDERPKKITNGTAEVIWENGKKSTIHHAIPILDIAQSIFDHSGNWPKRAGNNLFVLQGGKTRLLKKSHSLFGWLRESIEVNWMQAANLPTKEEIFEIVGSRCEQFDSVESYPHFPRIENIYYTCEDRPAGSGKHLKQFLDFFCPSSAIDRQLLLAATVTTFWGGPPGGRPAFQFAATTGQGAGKTTTASTIAKLSGGSVDFEQSVKREEIAKRLLSGESTGRVGLLDNIKAQTFSSASFEGMITSMWVSGHQMYNGNAAKPNYFTYFLTFNSPNFSRDMAQRLVSIVLNNSTKRVDWQADVDAFLKSHRNDVIDDIKAFFDRPKKKIPKPTRWAAWQGEIVSRLDDPESIIEELAMRESSNDGDAKIASDFLDHTSDYLRDYGYETPYRVHIGFKELATIVNEAVGSPHTSREAGLLIDRLISCGLIFNVMKNPSNRNGKGYLFWSVDGAHSKVSYDLANRIEIREIELDNAREKRRAEARRGTY